MSVLRTNGPLVFLSTEKSSYPPGYKFLQLIGVIKLPSNERITVQQLSDALLESNQVVANNILLGKKGKHKKKLPMQYTCTDFSKNVKDENFSRKSLIFFMILLKTLIVSTH